MDKEGMPPKNDCQNGRNMERRKTTGKMDWWDNIFYGADFHWLVEEDLKIMGIRNLHTVARDGKE
jgi:hypothetical protein